MPSIDEKKWELENAVSTLKRAEEIKMNKPLMRDVKKQITKEKKALENVSKDQARIVVNKKQTRKKKK